MVPTEENETVNESATTEEMVEGDGSLPLPDPEVTNYDQGDPEQPEIDQAFTVIVNGKQWIIGLGMDSQIYNWDVRYGVWNLFVLEPTEPEDVI